MGGRAGRRGEGDQPRLAYRALTVLLLFGLAALLPRVLPVATAHPWTVIGWVALLSAATYMRVLVSAISQVETTLRQPALIASVVVLDPEVALLVNLLALVSVRELRPGVSIWRILYNHTQVGLLAYVASLVVHGQPYGIIVGTLIAVPLCEVLNDAEVALGQWLSGRCGLRDAIRGTAVPFPNFASSYVLTSLLALLMVLLYQEVGWWSVGLLAVPLYLGYAAMRSAKTADERANELAERVHELEVMHSLGSGLLSAKDERAVLALGSDALRAICEDVVVAPRGERPGHLRERVLPGTEVRLWVPGEIDERRAAEIETVCSAIGLALQRLGVEGELRESQRAEAALAQGILKEGTTARSRVALNVHDDVLPYLAAAQIQSDNVLSAVEKGNASMAKGLAVRVRDAVSDGIAALRSVLDDLQRQTIVPGDLLPSIQRAAEQARLEHGLAVEIDASGFRGGLSHPVEILLTETITGLLTNVVRHAKASEARVKLLTDHGFVVVEVSDDGSGFDPEAVGAGHHGLMLMEQRAAIAHGEFNIDSAPGEGTSIRLRIPAGTASEASALAVPPSTPQPERTEAREPDDTRVSREAAVW